jgi:hypothetical protein
MTAYIFKITCKIPPYTDWTFSGTPTSDPGTISVKVGDTISFDFDAPVTDAYLTVPRNLSDPASPFGTPSPISLSNPATLTIAPLGGNSSEETWQFSIYFETEIDGHMSAFQVPDPELRVSSH